jgi:hypothetical protein
VKRSAVAAALVLAVVVLGGCAKWWAPPVEQRSTHGPTARQMWTLRMAMTNSREPKIDERRMWEDDLDLAIQRYLMKDPEAASSLQVSAFRFNKQVVTGMTQEQVLILLGPPEAVTNDQAQMEKIARRYWPLIKGNATEAWIYPLGWNLYFAGPKLIDITQYLERD